MNVKVAGVTSTCWVSSKHYSVSELLTNRIGFNLTTFKCFYIFNNETVGSSAADAPFCIVLYLCLVDDFFGMDQGKYLHILYSTIMSYHDSVKKSI